ncbi:MAG: DUF4214 domain-containing protein [Acidimicrobiales bacterium]
MSALSRLLEAPGQVPYTFSGLNPATTYTVTLTVNNDDPDSDSATAQATTKVTVGAPASVSIGQPTPGTAAVTWTLGPTNGATVTGHTVILSATANGPATTTVSVAGATTTTTSLPGLAPGTYFARVRTTSSDQGNSSYTQSSASIIVVPAASAPSAPTLVTISKSGDAIAVVTWAAGNDNGASVTGYSVVLSNTAGGTPVASKTVSGVGTATTSFPNLAPGTYFARVQAISSDQGNSGFTSTSSSITVVAPATVPDIPTAINATVSGGQITVTFTAPLASDSSAATSYRIRLLSADGSPVTVDNRSNAQVGISSGDSQGTHTFTTGISGQYSVDVAATNAAGSSGTATKSDIIVAIAPSVPRNVAASTTGDTVTVNWVIPATTGGAIDYYEVKVGSTTTIVPAPATSVTVSGLAAGAYTPTVKAFNTVPLSSAAASAASSVNVVVPPGAPTGVTGTATGQSVLVKWTAPANSGGSPVLNYKVTLNGVTKTVTSGVQTTFANVPYGKYVATVSATTDAGAGPVASSPEFLVSRAFQPFNTDEAFVSQLYKDILGRTADTGGRDYWASIVANNRANVPTVVKQFLSSPEFGPREPIIRLYLAYFNRAPDAGGFDYWTNLYVQKRINLIEASYYFSTSPEFAQTYGNLSDGQFVVLVYNNVLGRTPDLGGYNHWVTQLSRGLSRSQLMVEFSESPEFLRSSRNFVDITMVHRGMLNRIPNVSAANNEYNIWLPRLAGADDVDDLIMDIFGSDEYASRVTP